MIAPKVKVRRLRRERGLVIGPPDNFPGMDLKAGAARLNPLG